MTRRRSNPTADVEAFNARFKIGDEVEYRELKDGPGRRLKTRSAAEVLSGHTAVVWLDGKSGCVACSHCFPVAEASA